MNSNWRWCAAVLLILALMMFAGCSRKISQENYDKIEIGMSYDEVVAILGEPTACESVIPGTRSCNWGKEARMISLKFAVDNVVFRSAKGLK